MTERIELRWSDGDRLTVHGSGFHPNEQVALTMAIRAQSSTVRSGTGTFVQSSQSSSQTSTMTLGADGQGTFRMNSTVSVPNGTEIEVSAHGSQGGRATERTTVSHTR